MLALERYNPIRYVHSKESRVRQHRWGMSQTEWDIARGRLLVLLEAVASSRLTVTYGEAARVSFEGRFSARSGALMDLLSEVDEAVDRERGVMIASLVVRADTGLPGEGYFAFARDVLRRDVADRESFWRQEADAVWAAFGGEGPSR
jgi:hypothetical protein